MNQVIISYEDMYKVLTKEEIDEFMQSLNKINKYKREKIRKTLDRLENKRNM
jgi:tRNA(Ile)-lysidine synthase TilS/MesJ